MADVNYISFADQTDISIAQLTYPESGVNSLEYSDTLKLSNAKNVRIYRCTIEGGKEDCIDMNRNCENVRVESCTVIPHGKFGFTIKGGSKNIVLNNVVFDGHGSEVDIDLGNWSDQSAELTRSILLENVTSTSGLPVRVRVLWSESPKVIGGNVRVTKIPRLFVWIYRLLRAHKLVP